MSLKSLSIVSSCARRILPSHRPSLSLPSRFRIPSPLTSTPTRHLTHIKVRRPIVIDEATRIAEIIQFNNEMRERAGIYSEGLPFVEVIRILKAVDLHPDPILSLSVTVNVDKHTPHLRVDMRLPNPVSDDSTVLVFAEGELAERARAAGANIVGSLDLFPKILKGEFKFDKVICTPDMFQPMTAALARLLGPKGLMPTVKRGTVTEDIEAAIDSCKGLTEFVADKNNKMEVEVGKGDFSVDQVKQNIEAVMSAINALGATFTKTAETPHFVKSVSLSSTTAETLKANDLYEPRLPQPTPEA